MKNLTIRLKPNHGFLPYELSQLHDDFCLKLQTDGYTTLSIAGYANAIAHLGTWLHSHSISPESISNTILTRFLQHKCTCRGYAYKQPFSPRYIKRVKRFIDYLRTLEIIPVTPDHAKVEEPLWDRTGFSLWLTAERGLAPITATNYLRGVDCALLLLGYEPDKYCAATIRGAVTKHAKCVGPINAKRMITALRAYLRFLQAHGLCRSGLVSAIPTVPCWRLCSLPRYISAPEIEKIIASCDTSRMVGLRDRAILLLLARLALRAADIVNLSLSDIDWTQSTIRLVGKSKREVRLPLPQDAGDAILNYLEHARVSVTSTRLFLCNNAPHRPLSSSPTVSSIVRAAVIRSDIHEPPSSGTNLLRHSAATHMLRSGVSLDVVSTILRHQSPDTTLIYAKVDVDSLSLLAPPWPEQKS